MGSGKTESAITYMNEHADQKFIFITPYLTESNRIKKACPKLHFVEPSNKLKKYDFKKSVHTAALIKEGCNISTTHQAFKGYTPAVLEDIREQGYTLIIDENVDVLETFNFHPSDLQLAVDAGYISEQNGLYTIKNDHYDGQALSELFNLLKSRELVRIADDAENVLFFWALPPELITSFKDVFILTYMFEGQSLHHFLQIYRIPYTYIGIERTPSGGYQFSDKFGYVPEYVTRLGEMLHIIDNERLNNIGTDYYALSMNWFKSHEDDIAQLKKNVNNYYRNIFGDIPADRRLWGTYNGAYSKMRGKGYSKAFLTFNSKATNAYRKKDCLVYIANLFMNVNEKKFYHKHGIEVDEDAYALSIMVQWIWRSAIRDGSEVYLYIPSRRMRELLINWINTTSKGGQRVA